MGFMANPFVRYSKFLLCRDIYGENRFTLFAIASGCEGHSAADLGAKVADKPFHIGSLRLTGENPGQTICKLA
jgi:hypothetical protein